SPSWTARCRYELPSLLLCHMATHPMLEGREKMENVTDPPISERSRRWAATMEGSEGAADEETVADRDSSASIDVTGASTPGTLAAREEQLDAPLAIGATRAHGAGHR